MPKKKIFRLISLKEAQKKDICRICLNRAWPMFGNPIVLNYGKEYAHGKCLKPKWFKICLLILQILNRKL